MSPGNRKTDRGQHANDRLLKGSGLKLLNFAGCACSCFTVACREPSPHDGTIQSFGLGCEITSKHSY